MRLLDAIIQVLDEAHAPLHIQEITEKLLSGGLWKTSGKTPADTVSARLYTHIKQNGIHSPFIKVAPQTFMLRDKKENDNTPVAAPADTEKTCKRQTGSSGLSFTDCAQKVLEAFGNKKPMHYREITQRALGSGLIKYKR